MLAAAPQPTLATENYLRTLATDSTARPDLARTARLMLGAVAGHVQGAEPERAQAIADDVEASLEHAASPAETGASLAALGNTAANDLVGLGRDWRRSDKVVRVEAGVPITVYIRRDLTIQ